MAKEIRKFTATIPAGTAINAPVTVSLAFPIRVVRTVDWRIPPGAQGVVGWQLAMGGVQVVPAAGDKWVVDDGTAGTFYMDGYPDSGAWQLIGYNTGAYQHQVFLTFHLDLVVRKAPIPSPIHPALLAPVSDLSLLGAPVRRSP